MMEPRVHQQPVRFDDREILIETGEVARQADAAVTVRQGKAVVLVTVVSAPEARPGGDFFPLTVEYREKFAAAGRIPGSFLRREARISDDEVLISRIIDRSIRPLFPANFRNEVQVQATVFSADVETADAPMLALIGAGAALQLSGLPVCGPVGGLRIARIGGRTVPLPTLQERGIAEVDLVVAARRQGLVMVEGGAQQASEAHVLQLLQSLPEVLEPLFLAVEQLARDAGREPRATEPADPGPSEIEARLAARAAPRIAALLEIDGKAERNGAITALVQEIGLDAGLDDAADRALLARVVKDLLNQEMRARVLDRQQRLDGRGPRDIRPIGAKVGWLPSCHGSSLFTRGQTQAVVTCTLAAQRAEQSVETLGGMEQRRFLLHYNFPPYSVGEVRPLRGPGRREIGHGALARRALLAAVPGFDSFPFVIRVESDITESNGSSSMATVCGGSLALMDAGVPLVAPVAGIAMGLISDGDGRSVVLSDILGDEDHLGDMDFKVAGTRDGITAIQMDNKVGSLPHEVLEAALEQAREGRLHILDCMERALEKPRESTPEHAPRQYKMRVPEDAIGSLIGPRGATIRSIQDDTGAEVSVDDSGQVTIFATSADAASAARARIRDLAGVVEAGKLYRGRITGLKDFGAFVRIFETAEGLVHISEWDRERVESMSAVTRVGDEVVVRVLGVDQRGRIKLSRKEALDIGSEAIVNA
jgi:polyribonucleotide nucleotidyltransferase